MTTTIERHPTPAAVAGGAVAETAASAPSAPTTPATSLPTPSVDGAPPGDAMGQMLALLVQQGQATLTSDETKIRAAKEKLSSRLDDLLDKLKEAAAAAAKARRARRKKNFFEKAVDSVAKVVGDIVGAVVEFARDVALVPMETVVKVSTAAFEGRNIAQAFEQGIRQYVEESGTGDAVSGFVRGTVNAGTKVLEVSARVAAAQVTGDTDAMASAMNELAETIQTELLENPDFLEVVSFVAKAAAVTGAVMTGGVLGAVAIAAIAYGEIDEKVGVTEAVVGKEAAPWVRLGIQGAAGLGTGVALAAGAGGAAAGAAEGLRVATGVVQGSAAVIQGTAAIHGGVQALRRADARKRHADLMADATAIRHRMATLNRLIETLLGDADDHAKDQATLQRQGAQLVATRAAATDAAMIRA